MIDKLKKYIPKNAIEALNHLINQQGFYLRIVHERKTKRGDFRPTSPLCTITINHNLSKEQFLITLVHEIAHLHTFISCPKAKPHGKEWKQCFQKLMLPFLNPMIFEESLLQALILHFKNPKATTDSDPKLARLLHQTENKQSDDKIYIFDLIENSTFELNSRIFKILKKRRTRVECLELKTKKRYLIHGNASVTPFTT